jgi:outer membrane protein assembly factor BamD (BamD/ComL family)
MKPARLTFLLCGILSLALAVTANAQQNSERKTKQTVAMSQAVFEKLQEIQELVEEKQYQEGLNKLSELQQRKGLSPYERAQLHNLTAYTHYLREDYSAAIRSYEQVMREPDLPEALQQSTLKTLAQLHFTVENY